MILRELVIVAVLSIGVASPCLAYEVPTHDELALYSISQSELKGVIVKQVGLDTFADAPNFPNYVPNVIDDEKDGKFDSKQLDVTGLVQFGAMYEDVWTITQFYAHFFEPHSQKGLLGGPPSPDWALEDQIYYPYRQYYSYARAKTYLYAALTSRAKHDRHEMWGKTFQTLGHVIHRVHDMTAPETGRQCKGIVVVTHRDTTEI